MYKSSGIQVTVTGVGLALCLRKTPTTKSLTTDVLSEKQSKTLWALKTRQTIFHIYNSCEKQTLLWGKSCNVKNKVQMLTIDTHQRLTLVQDMNHVFSASLYKIQCRCVIMM